jgi:hypothetical protein
MSRLRPQGKNEPPHQIPIQFKEKMAILLGDGYQNFLTSLYETPNAGLRVNTLKILPEQFLRISPYELAPVPWCPGGLPDEFTPDSGYIPLAGILIKCRFLLSAGTICDGCRVVCHPNLEKKCSIWQPPEEIHPSAKLDEKQKVFWLRTRSIQKGYGIWLKS